VTSIGPQVPITQNRKFCQLNVGLHVPNGWSYTVAEVTYRGYADLDSGVVGTQTSTYYFSGNAQQATASTSYYGPYADDYLVADAIGISSLVWSQCNANVALNIKDAVRLNGSGNGLMTADSIDGKLSHIFGLQFRQC